MSENTISTVSGNIPTESLMETNSLLEKLLYLFKSYFGISEDEEEMETIQNAYHEELEADNAYKESIVQSLDEMSEYVTSVSDNQVSASSVSENGITVSGNLPETEFYDSITVYMETSTLQREESISYLEDIHSLSIVTLCGVGLIVGILFASNFSRWWKHG